MSAKRFHRRTFLHGAAGSLLALPLLEMASTKVRAAEPGVAEDGFPLRFIVFFNPNGCWPATWFPTGGETDFVLAQSMVAMEPFRDKLIILDGVNMPAVDAGPGEDHQQGRGGVLTGRPLQAGSMAGGDGSLAGWADGASLDQVIAAHIGATNPFASIEAGVRSNAYIGGEIRSRMV
ncbi:MAG TPA: DUF1552 domain-containing protein, partial [Nannocystaceae bacterium]|nr:DUF1552 domain-containing protein [Nannocystaceae bacterium]